jgi:hypothetical protein
VYGRARVEPAWRVIDVFATRRRDFDSRWPLWRGMCTTWTAAVVVVGEDFARRVIEEQAFCPATRLMPVEVAGGRLGDPVRRAAAGAGVATASEVMAHECGHTWQALWLGSAFLPVVGPVTLFREGGRPWNRFENEASELGQFGGLVAGSVREGFGPCGDGAG